MKCHVNESVNCYMCYYIVNCCHVCKQLGLTIFVSYRLESVYQPALFKLSFLFMQQWKSSSLLLLVKICCFNMWIAGKTIL